MRDHDVRWSESSTSARFSVACALLDSPGGRSLGRWLEDWRTDDPDASLLEGEWHITLPYTLWSEAGHPPGPAAGPEAIDLFGSRHSAIARLLNLSSQRISIETVGHVGAPDLSFLFTVDG
jgi:hypothetical protein